MAADFKPAGSTKEAGTPQEEANLYPTQLEEHFASYCLLFENSLDAILLASPQGLIGRANPAACRLLGWTEKELRRLEWSWFVDTDDPKWQAALTRLTDTSTFREELTVSRKDRTSFPAIISANIFNIEERPAGILITITDHSMSRTVRDTLEAEIARFQQLEAANIVGIAIANARGNIIRANDYYLNLLGVTQQEHLDGKVDWRKYTPPEWLPADEKAIAELREHGVCEPYEKEYERADGTRVSVYLTDAMLPGPEEQIAAFVIDITKRKRSERALSASEELFRTAFENSPVGMSLISLEGKILQVNRSFAGMLRYSIEELQRMHFKEFTHPEDAHIGRDDVLQMLGNNGNSTVFEKRYLTKAGETVWAHVNSALLKDSTGQPLYFITQILDITERKQVEEKLQYQAYLLENVNDAIVASDEKYALRVWNSAAERIYGWKAEEVLGKNGLEILQTRFSEADPAEMRRRIAAAGQYLGEATQLCQDGSRVPVEVASLTLRDSTGKITGYVSLNRDITQRKQAEQKLLAQLEELQRWYKTSLEREERILELKKEVNELLRRQHEPIRYPSAQEQT